MSQPTIREVQQALLEKGFDPGPIDGMQGPKTDAAIVAFKKANGLRARPYLGPITLGLLLGNRPPAPKLFASEPPWLRLARGYIGLAEYRGKRHNAQILKWWKMIRANFKDDETPWCAAYVGGVLEEAGIKSTRSAMARSYERWGVKLAKPVPGCVVTFYRGSSLKASRGKGHVGFVVGQDQRGNLMVLGGNQKNAVNVKPFSVNRVTSYRWPLSAPVPANRALPVVTSDGRLSTNEA